MAAFDLVSYKNNLVTPGVYRKNANGGEIIFGAKSFRTLDERVKGQ